MEFLSEYGMFLAQSVTVVLAIIVVIGAIANAGHKSKKQAEGHIEIVNLSEELADLKDHLQQEVLDEEDYKALVKARKKAEKEEKKRKKKQAKLKPEQQQPDAESQSESSDDARLGGDETEAAEDNKKRLFVLEFEGDIEASEVLNLREEISAIIAVASPGDQVLLCLESPGGMVHAYGLAASQLCRLKQAELELVIVVDKVAASGGYMMACVADQILAAPFAVIGSIGVVAEIPNFHRLLKDNKVDYEQHTAGEYKRTLTMFAENTDAARQKFKQELEETHELFKQFINHNRPSLDIEKVATGEHWYGTQALELGLIDGIQTSDDYILQSAEKYQVYSVNYEVKKNLADRLSISINSALQAAISSLWKKSYESGLFK